MLRLLLSIALLLATPFASSRSLESSGTYVGQSFSSNVALDALPAGTLYINGTANAATVTVTAITGETQAWTPSVTLPAGLSQGDLIELKFTGVASSTALPPIIQVLGIVEVSNDTINTNAADAKTAAEASQAELEDGSYGLTQIKADTAAARQSASNNTTAIEELPTEAEITNVIQTNVTPSPVLQYDIDESFIFEMPHRRSGLTVAKSPIYLSSTSERPRFAFYVRPSTKSKPGIVTSVEVLDSQGNASTALTVADETDVINCGVRDWLVISKVTAATTADTYTVKVSYTAADGSALEATGEFVVP